MALSTTRFPRLNVNVIVRGLPMGSFRVPVSVNAPDALTVMLEASALAVDAVMASVAISADVAGRLVLTAVVLLLVLLLVQAASTAVAASRAAHRRSCSCQRIPTQE